MTPTIFATLSPRLTIRSAVPGEVHGIPLPFSAARLWELERQGQIWTSCLERWRWMRSRQDGATMPEEAKWVEDR